MIINKIKKKRGILNNPNDKLTFEKLKGGGGWGEKNKYKRGVGCVGL